MDFNSDGIEEDEFKKEILEEVDENGVVVFLVGGEENWNQQLKVPPRTPIILSVMNTTTNTPMNDKYKTLELVKLVSEAIDELNQIGYENIANDIEKKLEAILEATPKMTFTYYDDETKTQVTKAVNF